MHQVHRFDSLPSTQDEIHRLAAAGAPAGTVVVTAEQVAGRGSRGRQWTSMRGGLWLTMLCRPAEPAAVELLSLRVGLAVADALSELGGLPPVALKWPNDLLLDDRKLGGILCEARWQGDGVGWVAVGVGLNVSNPLPPGARTPPARLAEWRPDLTPNDVLWPVVAHLTPLAEAASGMSAREVAAFGRRDWLAGRELVAPVPGVAAGIAADGALRVRQGDGSVVQVRTGEATPAVQLAP
jgi:BirA family biotin operon repressor/biotin-[acetyl-CoA-carboxylase] ligase